MYIHSFTHKVVVMMHRQHIANESCHTHVYGILLCVTCDMWHDSLAMCDMTHYLWHVWHDSLAMCDMTRYLWHVWHDSLPMYTSSRHPHMYESCHTYIKRTFTHMLSESRHPYEWLMSHTFMCHVTHTCMSHVTRVWVMSPTWMNTIVADTMNGSCHTHVWVMSYIFWVMPYNTKGMCVNVWTYIDIWGGYGQ